MRRFSKLKVLGIMLSVLFLSIFKMTGQSAETSSSQITATSTNETITIDGLLNESSWENATAVSGFIQKQQNEGQPSEHDTDVKVMYDDKYLYIGATCYFDPDDGIRVNDINRDFGPDANDLFGVSIDGFQNGERCQVFYLSPKGTQADMIVTDGKPDAKSLDWDAVWNSATKKYDNKWVVEIAIPFSVLDYKKGSKQFGMILFRINQALNELSSFPGVPRELNFFSMSYATPVGLNPSNSLRRQFTPYVLSNISGNKDDMKFSKQLGFDLRYGITRGLSLDLTILPDFGATEVDDEIINLTRFSLFLDEKRRFFQESASLLSAGGWSRNFEPFFSRTIGLDENGNPKKIKGGFRLSYQSQKTTAGLMGVRQNNGGTRNNFIVGNFRRSKKLGKGSLYRFGVMSTVKFDQLDSAEHNLNSTINLTNFIQVTPQLSFNTLVSKSYTKGKNDGLGFYGNLNYRSDGLVFNYDFNSISNGYEAGMGFVARPSARTHSLVVYPNFRGGNLPKYIETYRPTFQVFSSSDVITNEMQTRFVKFEPLYISFKNNATLQGNLMFNAENLKQNFSPLGLEVYDGKYSFLRYSTSFTSNTSKSHNFSIGLEGGKFYDANLLSTQMTLNSNFSESLSASISYFRKDVREKGQDSQTFYLLRGKLEIAFTTRMQFKVIAQYNSLNKNIGINSKFSWEYRPQSNINLIFNYNKVEQQTGINQSIGKVSYTLNF